ncbi:ATP-binding cassette domain-containing protein, partial [Oleiphilus sp. HI0125]|uniref:ATP-binding cassette domain-containing protein n=1 Tax=Oleiphilus sp. HI0125 TaxID=1822266 RepID=UPI000A8068B0
MLTNTVNASSLLVDSVSKRVELETGSLQVLSDISFSVPAGGSCALVGRSGSGKTTLLGILAGLDNASSGSVKIDEINISSLSEDECAKLRKERVG